MYHEKCGMDLSSIYDIDNILNVKKKQAQEDWLDNTSLSDIADIIDNSISAQATEIKIFSDPLSETPYFCILDNGIGMTMSELDNAMLPGSDREGKEDSQLELGRFGLGLKSASLSQCREFTVASKKFGKIRAMSCDLDVIES